MVMPNLTPVKVRKLYDLCENKICTGEEAAQCRGCLERRKRKTHMYFIRYQGTGEKIHLDSVTLQKARVCIDRMIELG